MILALAAIPLGAVAGTVDVVPGGGLAQAIAAASDGDVLRLEPGVHAGPVIVDKAVTLEGLPGAVVDGRGQGSTIKVTAPGVTIRALEVRNSGLNLEAQDSGVFLDRKAAGTTVEHNRLEDNLIGVYVWGAAQSVVRRNTIVGRKDIRVNQRGNGVQVWNAPGAKIIDNDISFGRDGIFTTSSKRNVFSGNRFTNVRFAVHYMYTNDSEVSRNASYGNDVGYALMYSSRLLVRDNLSEGDRNHGLMFNFANESVVEGNVIRKGGEKCVFIYNANNNRIADNRFEGCDIGVHFTAGSERNRITGNAFIGNRTQVKYVGTRDLEWSERGRGNYWSDNPAFDLNGDGIADTAYRPNDVVDRVVWSVPLAKLLLNSPAVQVVRWAQSQFPAITPGGVVDSAPLMRPPERKPGWRQEDLAREGS
ncbi:nitrous oxide reductase family maturation protein NosD [Azospirillum canadense]|uniref:nitrous oxide reductase family maturation protein NosD n=1 Tax=Azospirillum canadense TaxID=403962 RepID=UPI0022266FD8|nr:nitrous oxide reductase family maturation protein NosD [Azospirillum canadense]MCW2239047.1 nitrous oxidase accessory protein [Azospirillum canadense]